VPESVLFTSEGGFFENISGMYHEMTEERLYGTELTMGLVDMLAQRYMGWGGLMRYQSLFAGSLLDYQSTGGRQSFFNPIWSGMYAIIGNANNLLAHLEGRENLFTDNNYNLVRGQALALRAFIHFDLLRLYAPSRARAGDQQYIPYVTTYGPAITERNTFAEIITRCMADLNEAQALLSSDQRVFSGSAPSPFLAYTRNKMNYAAVLGLKARIFLYNEQPDSAYNYARMVMDLPSSTFVPPIDANEGDQTFYPEHLFSLSVVRMPQTHQQMFVAPANNSSQVVVSSAVRANVYEDMTADIRWVNHFEVQGAGGIIQFTKYLWPADIDQRLLDTRNLLPLIRLSEMYYIAAETAPTPDEAVTYLNQVRAARGLVGSGFEFGPLSPEVLNDEIRKEYRKEFFGEGQLFFYYKRRGFLSILMENNASLITPPDFYIWPLPIDELPLR